MAENQKELDGLGSIDLGMMEDAYIEPMGVQSTPDLEEEDTSYQTKAYKEVNDNRHFSMRDIYEYNKYLYFRDSNMSSAEIQARDKIYEKSAIRFADLHLTRNQMMDIPESSLSDKKVYDGKALRYAASMKRYMDDQGYNIRGYVVANDGTELRAVLESGVSRGRVTTVSPDVNRLGHGYINGYSVYPQRGQLANTNKADNGVKKSLVAVDYFFGDTTKTKDGQPVSNFKKENFGKRNANNYEYLGVTKGDKDKVMVHRKVNSSLDGVFYIAKANRFQKDDRQNIIQEHIAPKNVKELMEQVYSAAKGAGEPVALIEDVLDKDGEVDLTKVDTDQIIRYAKMRDVVTVFRNKQIEDIKNGKTATDFRSILMTDLSNTVDAKTDEQREIDRQKALEKDIANSINGALDKAEQDQEVDEELTYSTDDGDAPNAFAEAFAKAKKADNEVEAVDVDEAGAEDEDADLEGKQPAGSRQRLANMMVGVEDENGEPLSGRLPEEEYSSEHVRLLNVAKASAIDAGIDPESFVGFYDNDNVMHWHATDIKGNEVKHTLGQFFFPAEKDVKDAEGNILVKEGVTPIKMGAGFEELRVGGYDATFMAPSEPDKNGKMSNNYRHNLITRLKVTGVEQKMTDAVAASVKSQLLTRDVDDDFNADEVFDTTRLNNIYQGMTKLTPEAMVRPGVVAQAQASVRFDASWLDRKRELRYKEVDAGVEPFNPQSIRNSLRGLEGVFDEQASSDGKILGLKRYFTKEMMDFIKEHGDEVNFKSRGFFGQDNANGKGEKTVLQKEFLDVPAIKRKEYAAPMVEYLPYMKYDSPDRALMAMNMLMVAKEVIGGEMDEKGRDKMKVALMTVGGQTFEDAIVVSKKAAEEHGWKIGDKLADTHSNKGTIGYITGKDPDDPDYNADVEQLFAENQDLDMVQSPYSMGTRANMGLAHELADSKYIREIKNSDGTTRGVIGELSVIVTNMDAEHKVKLYELQDLGRSRHFSLQQADAVAAYGADGILAEVFKHNDRQHETLNHYLNVTGHSVDEKGVLHSGHIAMDVVANAEGQDIEVPSESALVISGEDAQKIFPSGPSYLELPINRSIGENGTNSRFVSILPANLRKDLETFDGQYREHDYQQRLENIASDAANLENDKMEYLRKNMPEDFVQKLGIGGSEDLETRYKARDNQFMDALASYTPDDDDIKREIKTLDKHVSDYEKAVESDQFGNDERGVKYSYTRRHIVAADLAGSATSITTNNTQLETDTVAISPALAANLGLVEPIDKEPVEKALASGDMHEIQEAYRNNYRINPKTKDDMVMAWRDPILHEGSVSGFKWQVDDNIVGMSVNPLISESFGLDFDGDQMGIWHPKTKAAQADLKGPMNMRNNYLDADGKLSLNIGMDNVDNYAHSNLYAKDFKAHGEDPSYNAKKSLKNTLNAYSENLSERRRQRVSSYLKPVKGDSPEVIEEKNRRSELYGKALAVKQLDKDAKLPPEQESIYNVVSKMYIDASKEHGDKMHKLINNMGGAIMSNNYHSKSQFVDFRSEKAVQESLQRMMDTGAKGNEKALARAMKYYKDGVTYDDKKSVRQAMGDKVDLTGRAGAQMLRTAPLVANENVEVYNTNNFNGTRASLDITEQPTQAVLQIKHDPAKSPQVKQFLNDSSKFTVGPKTADDKDKPLWVKIPKDLNYEELVKDNLTRKEKAMMRRYQQNLKTNPDKENKPPKRVQEITDLLDTAKKMDIVNEMQKETDYQAVLDINTGIITNNQNIFENGKNANDKRPYKQFSVEPSAAYQIGLKGIYEDLGLDISMKNVKFMNDLVRDDKTNKIIPYEENFESKASAIDHLAMKGYKGVSILAAHNDKAIAEGKPEETKEFGDSRFGKHFSTDYEALHEKIENQFANGKDEYQEKINQINAELTAKMEAEKSEASREMTDNAFDLDMDVPDTFDDLDLDNAFLDAQNQRETSINNEMNGTEYAGGDFIDTAPGVHYGTSDGKDLVEENVKDGLEDLGYSKHASKSMAKDIAKDEYDNKDFYDGAYEAVLSRQLEKQVKNSPKVKEAVKDITGDAPDVF